MSTSRVVNTKRNIIFSYLNILITILFSFIIKYQIVHVLGDQYLGLANLFRSILQILNVAELGFSSAIIYNMYKPLAENDTESVCRLLNYYRKVYKTVGFIVGGIGFCLLPFIRFLIHDDIPSDINIYLLFFLYLFDTVISYWMFAYKIALLEAVQRMDLTKIAFSIVNLCQYLIQLFILTWTKNYYAFFSVSIISTILRNLFVALISEVKYPHYKCAGEIDLITKEDIHKRVKGLLIGNISSITYTTLDSIVLSSFVGLTSVAIYGNYYSICNCIMNFISSIRGAMQASVGNSIVKETIDKNYKDMLLWQFLFSMISTWCVTCMISLYQPFMLIWMGKERLLNIIDVILLAAWFFLASTQNSFYLYLGGNGLWIEMKWPYIVSTFTNLFLNIILGKLFGITGVLFASVFTVLVFGFIWQCKIVFKIYFKRSAKYFYIRMFEYIFLCIISSSCAYYVNSAMTLEGIQGLFIRMITCTFVSLIMIILVFGKSRMFREAIMFIKKTCK